MLEFVLHDWGGHCKADRSTQSVDEVSVGDDHSSLHFGTMRLKGGDSCLEDAPYANSFDQQDYSHSLFRGVNVERTGQTKPERLENESYPDDFAVSFPPRYV